MKEFTKLILKTFNLYHFFHTFYRNIIDVLKKTFFQIKYLKYKGNGFICNYCNASYQKFIPEYPSGNIAEALSKNEVIAGYGANVFCPKCMSKNRERLLLAVFKNIISIENKLILHFSPEKFLHRYLKNKATVTTGDILPGFYKNIDKSIIYSDATALQFNDETFDMVIANHILEHIPEDMKAIMEINRVIKKGGVAILQVPFSEKLETTIEDPYINDATLQEKLYGQKDHVRIYSLNNYLERLAMGGFKTKILTADFLKQFSIHAIQEKECVILAFKPI